MFSGRSHPPSSLLINMEEDGDCSVPSIFDCLYSLLQPHPSLKNQFLPVSHGQQRMMVVAVSFCARQWMQNRTGWPRGINSGQLIIQRSICDGRYIHSLYGLLQGVELFLAHLEGSSGTSKPITTTEPAICRNYPSTRPLLALFYSIRWWRNSRVGVE